MINIVIPMAGLGTRFTRAGFKDPKPFIDVGGKPMIIRVLENLSIAGAHFTLIIRKEHTAIMDKCLSRVKGDFKIRLIQIDKPTEGAICTVLFSHRYVNNDDLLLLANSDQIVDFGLKNYIDDMLTRGLDGSILTFRDKDAKWSYARVNEQGMVEEVREKAVISEFATVGLYLFRRGRQFIENSIDMIIENHRVNNEFYTAPVYNFLIKNGLKIGIFNIDREKMHGLGTPEDLEIFLKNVKKKKCIA